MKRNSLLMLGVIWMTMAGPTAAAPSAATQAHDHGASTASLQLNAGKKWETDAALRQAMGSMRQSIEASLHEIHENRASNQKYAQLARKVEREVAAIVANCKLEPRADAQLHLIVAELLDGAEQMAGKAKNLKRQGGAIKVIDALNKYPAYFDDTGFKPIGH